MISVANVKQYCKNYEEIENYQEAISDASETWTCHHKLENIFTEQELKDMGIYYDVKPGELIFIRRSEHQSNAKLHIGIRRRNANHKGKKHGTMSKEHKRKLSEVHKGKHHSEETKQKLSEAKKGRDIICIETGEIHHCRAWRSLGYTHALEVAKGKCKTCKGLHFEYIN